MKHAMARAMSGACSLEVEGPEHSRDSSSHYPGTGSSHCLGTGGGSWSRGARSGISQFVEALEVQLAHAGGGGPPALGCHLSSLTLSPPTNLGRPGDMGLPAMFCCCCCMMGLPPLLLLLLLLKKN